MQDQINILWLSIMVGNLKWSAVNLVQMGSLNYTSVHRLSGFNVKEICPFGYLRKERLHINDKKSLKFMLVILKLSFIWTEKQKHTNLFILTQK